MDELDICDGYYRDLCFKLFKIMVFFGFFFVLVILVFLIVFFLGIFFIFGCCDCKKEFVLG